MRNLRMNQIELHPKNPGPVIVGNWKDNDTLYLVGLGGACRWSESCDGGALPLAVAVWRGSGATIAPVHPLCHVDENQTSIRLGTETFNVKIRQSAWRRHVKFSLVLVVLAATFVGGWCLRMRFASIFPVTAHVIEESYVF